MRAWHVLALVTLLGCRRSPTIAEVTKPHGDVNRDTASSVGKWEQAPDGAKLSMGDGVKTGATSDTVVKLTAGGTITVASNTTIRLLATAPGAKQPKVGVETGEASIEAENGALDLETSIGRAHIEAGGKLRVAASDNGSRVEVTVGAAHIDTEGGGVDLAPGKSFDVSLGGAIVEHDVADAGADSAAATAPPKEETKTDEGKVVVVVHGAGVRVQAKGATAWTALPDGLASVNAGDTVDVPGGASVDVQRGSRRGRIVGQGRFVAGDPSGATLGRATGGHAELEASSDDVAFDVPGGTIVAKAASGAEGRSRLGADVRANETRIDVRQGSGEVRGKGAAETLRAGDSAVLGAKGNVTTSGRGPAAADLSIRAGESLVVRDPRPPTAIGFDFSSVCPGAGVVSRKDASVRGERRANMFVPGGHYEYAINCIGADGVEDKPAATGAVTVIADSGRADLPRLPPATVVDTDGRRYTVLYQNLLPSVIARWMDAPAGAKGFVLHVDQSRFDSDTPKKELKTGTVGEGTHTLWWEAKDGTKKSAETTLVIKFDNAAPAANIREPDNGSFAPGDTVKVSGTVAEGW